MSDAALDRATPDDRTAPALAQIPAWAQFALVIAAGVLLSLVWDGAKRWPAEWVVPAEAWLTEHIEWLKGEATIFGVPFKEITRTIGDGLKAPVKWAEYLLFRGFKSIGLGPLPWPAVVAGVCLFAHWVGGWRLTLLCGACPWRIWCCSTSGRTPCGP